MRRYSALLLPLLWAALSATMSAQGPSAGGGEPREVTVNFYVVDVMHIDDANQTVDIDFGMWLMWRDPRLAGGGNRTLAATEAWNPDLGIVNDLSLSPKRPGVLEVDDEGNVRLRQRYIGKITNQMNFVDFPLDRQTIGIRLLGPYSSEHITYVSGPMTGREERFSIPDYSVGDLSARDYELQIASQSFKGFIAEMPARRHLNFYLWSVILPLVMVVLMAWIVFWIDPGVVAPRVGLGATSVLTLVAYRFALQSHVPNLSYLTRMDIFLLGAFVLVFGALAIAVITGNLHAAGRNDLERRVTLGARWLYPVLLAGTIIVAFVL